MTGARLFVVKGKESGFVNLLGYFGVMGDEFDYLLGPSRCLSSEIIRVRPLVAFGALYIRHLYNISGRKR